MRKCPAKANIGNFKSLLTILLLNEYTRKQYYTSNNDDAYIF